MPVYDFRNKTAVIGVGSVKVNRDPSADSVLLAARALKDALQDAGLQRSDIDGLITHQGVPETMMDKLPEFLGLNNLRFSAQPWAHGRMGAQSVQIGAMAVATGLADYVAYVQVRVGSQLGSGMRQRQRVVDSEANREGGGTHLESPPYGFVSPHAGAAMSMQLYFSRYGGTIEEFATVAITCRRHAAMNPAAHMYQRPLTLEDYLNSALVVDPLRVPDCSLPGNAAFCMIITTADRAKLGPKPPIYIKGMQGASYGKGGHYIFGRTGLGMGQQPMIDYVAPNSMPVYDMAGVSRSDIDALYILDSFSPLVLFTLEEYGFCKAGEALKWIQGGRIGIGGELPVNTNGGGLGEAHTAGGGHMVEAVRQLRGGCGPRQVQGAELAQFAANDGVSIIFGGS